MAKTLVTVVHGSHLFGTATPQSDLDYQSVILPDAEDILLGRLNRSWATGTKDDPRRKNGADDLDRSSHDLHRYMALLADAQPMALEILFAPSAFHVSEPHPIWDRLVANADRIASRKISRFIGYCRRQATLYGAKGERLAAAEGTAKTLDGLVLIHGIGARLGPFVDDLVSRQSSPFVFITPREMQSGSVIRHLSVCDRLVPETATLGHAARLATGIVNEYGERARRARDGNGVDWKAMGHAVRIGHEALEFLETGRITLPRPDAPHLLDIRRGLLAADQVLDEVDCLLREVEAAAARSPLPEEVDKEFVDSFVREAHLEAILSDHPRLP